VRKTFGFCYNIILVKYTPATENVFLVVGHRYSQIAFYKTIPSITHPNVTVLTMSPNKILPYADRETSKYHANGGQFLQTIKSNWKPK